MSSPFLGQIMMFGGNFTIAGWAACDGQLLPIAQNTALFSLLGTIYGGDGETTFGLPDLRGRVPIHRGNGPGLDSVSQGQRSGVNAASLSVSNMPSHNHTANNLTGTIKASDSNADSSSPTGKNLARGSGDLYSSDATNQDLAAGGVAVTGSTENAGSGQSFSLMQPFLGLNFLIALTGIFPSSN